MMATRTGARPPNAAPDVANMGIVRPPRVYRASLFTGSRRLLAIPLPLVTRTVAEPLGVPVVVVAIVRFAWAAKEFRAAGTPVPARKPTTAIVRTGPYRLSRNPIYLAFSLLQLGI